MQLTAKDGWSPLYVDGDVNGKFTVKTTKDGNPTQKFYWTNTLTHSCASSCLAKRGDITVEK